jgi:hypothetical protein
MQAALNPDYKRSYNKDKQNVTSPMAIIHFPEG